jgi:hypothetical protein
MLGYEDGSPLHNMSDISEPLQQSLDGMLGYEIKSPHRNMSDMSEDPQQSLDEVFGYEIESPPHIVSNMSEASYQTLDGTFGSEIESSPYIISNVFEVPQISMIDRWMSEKHDPWSQYKLSCSAIDNEQGDEASEVAALEDLFGAAVTLAEYRNIYGEFALQTLRQEFQVAKAAERINNSDEAEYHCCRILERHSQIDVHSFLGIIFAKASRFEDASIQLFFALTDFIVRFPSCSWKMNYLIFGPIKLLFEEILRLNEQDWASLASCMTKMMASIDNAYSEGKTVNQIFPRLITYGYSLAHECSALEFFRSAKHMYGVLLDTSPLHLDPNIYRIEKAKAHQKYGLLLKNEKSWMSSARQLLLACEAAKNTGPNDIRRPRLIEFLKSDYTELLPHLTSTGTDEVNSIAERIWNILTPHKRPNSPLRENISEVLQVSYLEECLLSSDSPLCLATPEPSAISHVAQFAMPLRTAEASHGGIDWSSTASMSTSVSHKHGLTTLSKSDITV